MKVFALFAVSLALAACGSSTSSSAALPDVTADVATQDLAADVAPADTAVADVGADTVAQDVAAADAPADVAAADVAPAKDFGFTVRKPQDHTVQCKDSTSLQQADLDWICSINVKGNKGWIYVQGDPVGCTSGGMSNNPTFLSKGWFSSDKGVVPLSAASYDWGGNHHNDSLSLTLGSLFLKAYHSSFGFGWRACQNIDCLQVLESAGGTPTEDGCTKERTLPIVCSQVQADGSYDALTDLFKPCPGDPNYP